MAERKFNLLFIFTDEQRSDTLACYGNDRISTPNLNALAQESFVFENAYVTQPICTPSRSTIMTGMYPHTTRCLRNSSRLAADMPTLAEMLSPAVFNDLFLEEIRRETQTVDHSIYHLDSPGAIKHLDALLTIADLDCIEWVPGAGASNDPLDWLDLIRKIQAAGKKVSLATPVNRIRPLLNAVSRGNVFLYIECPDEPSAWQALAELEN